MRTLSSGLTFLMKVIFPMLWISGFGLGTLVLWLSPMMSDAGHSAVAIKWQFLVAWIAGAAFVLWICGGLKRVRVDSKNLYISNYRHEISVPLSTVSDVTEHRWINIHPVTVHFSQSTEFGRSVTFMPTTRLFGFLSSHPVVADLKQLSGLPA